MSPPLSSLVSCLIFAKKTHSPALQKSKKSDFKETMQGNIGTKLLNLLGLSRGIDEIQLEELKRFLIKADVGLPSTEKILKNLQTNIKGDMQTQIKKNLLDILPNDAPLKVTGDGVFCILLIGINGSGKTTTAAKLSRYFTNQNKSVLLAAADTFRAAAGSQLDALANSVGVEIVGADRGSDPASIAYSAYQKARANKTDVLIVDTAGRLHTQTPLLDELKKIKRVLAKLDGAAPNETLLVLDGNTGQNALVQTEVFNKSVGVDALCINKLDGSTKGGSVFAISAQNKLPIRFLGVGEGVDDLWIFQKQTFVDNLFSSK